MIKFIHALYVFGRRKQFWLVCIAYGICTGKALTFGCCRCLDRIPLFFLGTFSGWGAILDVNLKHFGIDEVYCHRESGLYNSEVNVYVHMQAEAGWIGFYSNVAGSVAGLLFSG